MKKAVLEAAALKHLGRWHKINIEEDTPIPVCTNSGWVPENTRAPHRQFTRGDSGPFIRDYTLLSRHPKKKRALKGSLTQGSCPTALPVGLTSKSSRNSMVVS